MKIVNFCLSLKNKQINYYLSKLPEVYRTCDIPIVFVPNNYFGYIILKFYIKKYNLLELTFKESITNGYNICGTSSKLKEPK